MTSKVIGQGFPQVLVVPHECSIKGERILVATDGSEAGETAAETAINMGKNCSALKQVHVLSVASSEGELERVKALTETVCTQGKEKAPSVDFYPLTLVGKPAADIIAKTAKEKEVDMILIGGHGKGLSKLLMGHVTEKVIGRAHCAVLVIEKKRIHSDYQEAQAGMKSRCISATGFFDTQTICNPYRHSPDHFFTGRMLWHNNFIAAYLKGLVTYRYNAPCPSTLKLQHS